MEEQREKVKAAAEGDVAEKTRSHRAALVTSGHSKPLHQTVQGLQRHQGDAGQDPSI